MFMNRWLSRAEIVELNKLDAVEESLVFARLGVHRKSGAVDCFLEQDADRVIGLVRRRPPQADRPSFCVEAEDVEVIDFNAAAGPFERIADGIERLIEVLVPKEAVPPERAAPMLAAAEAAAKMRLHAQTVMRLCRERRLVASKLGGKWLIPQESVDAYIRTCEVIHGRKGGK